VDPRRAHQRPGEVADHGLPDDLVFRTRGQLAVDILTDGFADGVAFDFVCGDEVYGNCSELRQFCEEAGQGYVLRVSSSFRLTLARGVTLTCAQAVTRLLKGAHRWEVRSAGAGSEGQRWYAWAWLATAALLRDRTDTQAPPSVRPDQSPPADLGMIPLTVPEITHLLTTRPAGPGPPGHAGHWLDWRRRHQARSRWYHQRTRLARETARVS
jgi:hypothetical protein